MKDRCCGGCKHWINKDEISDVDFSYCTMMVFLGGDRPIMKDKEDSCRFWEAKEEATDE